MHFLFCCIIFFNIFINASGLDDLEKILKENLSMIEYPPAPWHDSTPEIFDVVIVGGGMAGLTASFALLTQGISHIQIFDENAEGFEGPWLTYARMNTLRSNKNLTGPALSISQLTFHAWYTAQFGDQAWDDLRKIPTDLWAEYLQWYKKVLNLPIKNNHRLQAIIPENNMLHLIFKKPNNTFCEVFTRKVVLATGRGGFGGREIPSIFQQLSSSFYTHTGQIIKQEKIANKDIVIVGTGASAFDTAAYVLEHGAHSVTLLMRRSIPPLVCKDWYLSTPGAHQGFYNLSNDDRWHMFKIIFSFGTTTPVDSINRLKNYDNIKLYPNITIQALHEDNQRVKIETNSQTFTADHIILATGFAIDGFNQLELANIIDDILLWQEIITPDDTSIEQKLGRFPFLGSYFEFIEKVPGSAPYLKNIHCLNYAASLSHGLISGDIGGVGTGAQRLALGITSDLFTSEAPKHLANLAAYQPPSGEVTEEDFAWLLTTT